jgi:hypothetical protein
MVGIVRWGKVGTIITDEKEVNERCVRLNGKEGTYFFLAPICNRTELIRHLEDIQPYLQWKWKQVRFLQARMMHYHELISISLNKPSIPTECIDTIDTIPPPVDFSVEWDVVRKLIRISIFGA